MRRVPLWFLLLLVLIIVGLGVYAYFTTPLPLGLSSVIRTPGGANTGVATAPTTAGGAPVGARTPAGQPLVLGSTTVVVQAVQHGQDPSNGGRTGPQGLYTVVQVALQNGGSKPLTPQVTDFRLVDDRGREYAVDAEATRTINTSTKHRDVFDSTVSPGGQLITLLAFETAADANALTLRVSLGYGEVELPR